MTISEIALIIQHRRKKWRIIGIYRDAAQHRGWLNAIEFSEAHPGHGGSNYIYSSWQ